MSLLKEKLELKVEEAEFKAQHFLGRFSSLQKWTLLICLASVIPGYFLARAIGNFYFGRQYRQYLTEARPSFRDPKGLLIERIDIGSLGENEYAIVAQVVNPNLDLAAKAIAYEFKFIAANGAEAALSQSGKFYILPNQKKYLVAPKIFASSGVARAVLTLAPDVAWQKKSDLPQIKLVTNQPKGIDQLSPFGYALEGNITNQSSYFIKEARLTFLLYGAGGKIIGGSQRSEFSLKPFETRSYKQIWAGISGRNVVRAEAYAETNLLDKENLSAPEFEGGAGDLGR